MFNMKFMILISSCLLGANAAEPDKVKAHGQIIKYLIFKS